MKKIFITLAILSVCQIARAVDVNSFDPNLYLQKIKELEQTVKAQQQKIDQLTAAIVEAKKEIEQLQTEATKLKEENAKLQEQIGGSASAVPFTGEETPLTMVEAYPQKYIGKTFIAIGRIAVRDYYNFRYQYAKESHISLYFVELRPDNSQTGVRMDVYVRREISKDLVEKITEAVGAGHNSEIIRVKASILENRYNPDSLGIMAELIDWQFLSSDKKSWQDWAISEGTAKPDVGTNDNLKDEIIYRGKKRDMRWFNYMYKEFQNKIAFVDGKYIYITGSTVYEPLTREQFADALNSGFILTKQRKVGDKTVEQSIP